jgi:hypothetical protein
MHRSSSAFNTSSCRVFRQSSAKTQGIASELLRRSALGLENAFPPDRVSAQLRPAQKLRVLSSQAATGTTPQALSAMNAMIQLNVVALHHLYAAEQW